MFGNKGSLHICDYLHNSPNYKHFFVVVSESENSRQPVSTEDVHFSGLQMG